MNHIKYQMPLLSQRCSRKKVCVGVCTPTHTFFSGIPYHLPHRLTQIAFIIDPNGAVWLIMPKKKFASARDVPFSREEMQAAALQTDFVDNKTASFSGTDDATRCVIRKEYRHKYA